jgi:MFS family permease
VTCAAAAVAPGYLAFGLILFTVGLAAQTFTTSTNSLTQMSTEPRMRGRVIAILLAIALGGTPIGAPIAGWVADHFGPRWALAVGAASGLLAAAIATLYLIERKRKPAAMDLHAKPAENAF